MAIAHDARILVINAGSSSIKFALYGAAEPAAEGNPAPLQTVFKGAISHIGASDSSFSVQGDASDTFARRFAIPEHVTACSVLVEWLVGRLAPSALAAIAYRIVYGGPDYGATQAIDADMLATLYGSASNEPEHLPQAIHLVDMLRRHYPALAHIACFDSAFHSTMPHVASALPIPRRYQALGLKRYGFHGLSCAWLIGELARVAGPEAAGGKVIIAHLGGGASVTALEHGRSCDTSMGLTPTGGMMMGTRSGDLDPGLVWHLARLDHMSAAGWNHMVNHQSGLLGVSDTSGDLQVLLAAQASDSRAREAVDMFCYQARKTICAMTGAIDGIDTLIFAGGVGVHAAEVRARLCNGLSHLGVTLDAPANEAGAPVISAPSGRVCVRVMHTDEEAMMADQARRLLAAPQPERRHD